MIHAKELKKPILHTLSLMPFLNMMPVPDAVAESSMPSVIYVVECRFWQCSEFAVLSVSAIQSAKQVSRQDENLEYDTGVVSVLKISDRRKMNFRKTYDTGHVTFMVWV